MKNLGSLPSVLGVLVLMLVGSEIKPYIELAFNFIRAVQSGLTPPGSDSPTLTEIASWQRVNVLPINMTLVIPADWTRAGLQWAWSPKSLGTPGVAASWTDLSQFGGDVTLLPRQRRELSARPIDLGWAQGTQYTFELMGGSGEGPIGAETHMIVQTDQRVYDATLTMSG